MRCYAMLGLMGAPGVTAASHEGCGAARGDGSESTAPALRAAADCRHAWSSAAYIRKVA